VRVSDETADRLDAVCRRTETRTADYIRTALVVALEADEAQAADQESDLRTTHGKNCVPETPRRTRR
jgi:predicted DNA-binding protein